MFTFYSKYCLGIYQGFFSWDDHNRDWNDYWLQDSNEASFGLEKALCPSKTLSISVFWSCDYWHTGYDSPKGTTLGSQVSNQSPCYGNEEAMANHGFWSATWEEPLKIQKQKSPNLVRMGVYNYQALRWCTSAMFVTLQNMLSHLMFTHPWGNG